jgi:tetratricopeptide (TPR) repeat protein
MSRVRSITSPATRWHTDFMSSAQRSLPLARWHQDTGPHRAGDFLREGRAHERSGCMVEAVQWYNAAVDAAERDSEHAILAESLRRLAIVYHQRHEPVLAREFCERSQEIASEIGNHTLAAEALNALAGFDFESGSIEAARKKFRAALDLGGASAELRGRAEQNLGILANIQGSMTEALTHYQQSLLAFESVDDQRGCAIAYHNLGMVNADLELWDEAEGYFRRSLDIATVIGDLHLQGLSLLNSAEVHLSRQHYDRARQSAETALGIFDQLGSKLDKADAYRVIGRTYREIGRYPLAESRLRSAIELAVDTESVLSEAEATRELAVLYEVMGRKQDALGLLNAAHALFTRLGARVDLADVVTRINQLEETVA